MTNHQFLTMNDQLQEMIAKEVYEAARKRHIVGVPHMPQWGELTIDERKECMIGIQLWLRGLGANEVAEEWFKRSGLVPGALWRQLPGYYEHDQTWGPFAFAALDMLDQLVKTANEATEMYQEAHENGQLYGAALYEETPSQSEDTVSNRAFIQFQRLHWPIQLQTPYQRGVLAGYRFARENKNKS